MGTQLNKQAYQKLIDENIEALEKHMPEHSLEKKHTIDVLKWSIKQIYDVGEAETTIEDSGLNIPVVTVAKRTCPYCGSTKMNPFKNAHMLCGECFRYSGA